MPAGRPKKPQELKSLQGTSRKDRMSESLEVIKFENITQLEAVNVQGLETAAAKKIFNERANMLIANKMLAPQDIDNLIIYANAMAVVMDAAKKMRRDMFTKTLDKNGKLSGYVPNPYLKLFKDMAEIVNRVGSEFGFSPLSRMKFKLEPEAKKDPFQELLDNYNN